MSNRLYGPLEQYAATGLFRSVNVGGDIIAELSGTGSPEGVVDADYGSKYVNRSNGDTYNKTTASGTLTGWELVVTGAVSTANFYTDNGAMTGDRTVALDSHTLTIDGTEEVFIGDVTNSRSYLYLNGAIGATLYGPSNGNRFEFTTGTNAWRSTRPVLLSTTQSAEINTQGNITLVAGDAGALVLPIGDNVSADIVAPADGMIKYDDTLQEIRVYVDGQWDSLVTQQAIAGGTSITVAETPSGITISSSTGNDDTIALANAVNSGAMSPGDFAKVNHITVTQAVNLDNLEEDVVQHWTLFGQSDGSTNFGTFSNLPDNANLTAILGYIDNVIAGLSIQTVVADIAARNAQIGLSEGDLTYVLDASADATVDSGAALYVYDGSAWQKLSEFAELDVVTNLGIGARTASTIEVTNTSGTNAVIPAAVPGSSGNPNDGDAGLLTSADAFKLSTLGGYAATVGNGSSSIFTLNHGLGSQDVVVDVVTNDVNRESITVNKSRPTVNTVKIDFGGIVPSANQFRVLVHRTI